MRSWLLALLVAIAGATGCDRGATGQAEVAHREGEPAIIYIDGDDPRMAEAMAKARGSALELAERLAAPNENQNAFSVKVPVSDGTVTEHVWLADVSFDGQAFRGNLANRPNAVKGVRQGDEVAVKPGEISDWMYVEDGLLVGGYTMRVLRDSVPPEERARLESEVPFRFER